MDLLTYSQLNELIKRYGVVKTAKILGVNRKTIYRWRKGITKNPKPNNVKKIHKHYKKIRKRHVEVVMVKPVAKHIVFSLYTRPAKTHDRYTNVYVEVCTTVDPDTVYDIIWQEIDTRGIKFWGENFAISGYCSHNVIDDINDLRREIQWQIDHARTYRLYKK
ncbi:MAG: hypothetical protein QW533_06890 [Thermoplasmata archaeon]